MMYGQNANGHAANLGWEFYYYYFLDLDAEKKEGELKAIFTNHDSIDQKKSRLTTNVNLNAYTDIIKEVLPQIGTHGFELVTYYPGLLIGSGYQHEVGAKEEFKLGFFFDHTTGLPILPGSSVKGVLRSAFEASIEYIKEKLKKLFQIEIVEDAVIKALKVEIFGPDPGDTLERPMKSQDFFYDAVPIDSYSGDLLGTDSITPHINRKNLEMSEFSDPVPLPFIKVLPGVVFRFDFELKGSKVIPQLDIEKKEGLFKSILQDLGLGAKTNVGYGQLMTSEEYKSVYLGESKKGGKGRKKEEDMIPEKYHYSKNLEDGDEIVGRIMKGSKSKPDQKRIYFIVSGEKVVISNEEIQAFEIGQLVKGKAKATKFGSIHDITDVQVLEDVQ